MKLFSWAFLGCMFITGLLSGFFFSHCDQVVLISCFAFQLRLVIPCCTQTVFLILCARLQVGMSNCPLLLS
jgi:hypothetical protein